jgi:hypothetical protein
MRNSGLSIGLCLPHPCASVCGVASSPPARIARPQPDAMARLRPKMSFDPNCEYNAATKVLTITFTVFKKGLQMHGNTGRPYIYDYAVVPQAVADAFLDDKGNGEYYNEHIRNDYTYTRLN